MERQAVVEQFLALINYGPDPAEGLDVQHLSAGDWDGMLEFGLQHKVTPLLYHGLLTRRLEGTVPADVWQSLRRSYLTSAAHGVRNLSLIHI